MKTRMPQYDTRASLLAQLVKNPPAMQDTWIRSLGWEDPLKKGKATHSVFWAREFHGLYSPFSQRVGHNREIFTFTSWQIDGETVADFIFLGSKITADGDYSHGIKRCLPLGRKVMTNLDSIFKNITLSTKVHRVKAMVFPVAMYGCKSWTIKKAEGRRIDAFELWCWRRLLRVPWTARRSNQSILKEISPGYSLEGLMLKLKL